MHKTSYKSMSELVEKYLCAQGEGAKRIVDIGSHQVEGNSLSYRPLFERPGWSYVGVDLIAGRNVDEVLKTAYQFPFETDSVDVIISGQAFEHIEFFWLTWKEMVRVLKPGGYIFLIAPSRGVEHRYPADCWRFFPDGFRALAKLGDMEMVEVRSAGLLGEEHISEGPFLKRAISMIGYLIRFNYAVVRNFWGDTVGVFRKPID